MCLFIWKKMRTHWLCVCAGSSPDSLGLLYQPCAFRLVIQVILKTQHNWARRAIPEKRAINGRTLGTSPAAAVQALFNWQTQS